MIPGFEIVKQFEQDPAEQFTIRQLAKATGRSYGATHADVQTLAEEDIIKTRKVGASTLCGINLHNEKTIALLTAASLLRAAENLSTDQRKITNSAVHHLRDSCLTIWLKDNELHCLMRPHTQASIAGGLVVHAETIDTLYPNITKTGIALWGAETYWRMASELQRR